VTLALEDQHRLAVLQDDLRGRVQAAAFSAAVTMFNAAANADPAKQALRVLLVNAIIKGGTPQVSDRYVTAFSWVCVSRSSVNDITDLTDAFLLTTCGTAGIFDGLAQELMS